MREGAPLFPEQPEDDESKAEAKDTKDSKDKTLSFFEKLVKGDLKGEEEANDRPKSIFDLLKVDKPEENVEAPEETLDAAPEAAAEDAEFDDPSLEVLAEDEKQQVAEQYVDARTADVAQEMEQTPEDTPDEAAVAANARLLEHLQEKIKEGEPVEDAIDEAVTETLDELGIAEGGGEPPEEPPLPPTEMGEPEPEEPDPIEPYEDTTRLATLPPVTVIDRVGGMAEATPTTPAAEPEIVTVPRRRREAGNLLLGGVIGYMVGRRRGRIKTEARLLPIQEKLTNQVKDLHEQIATSEEKIRKLAYEKAVEKTAPAPEKPVEKQPETPAIKPMESIGNLAHERLAQFQPERPKSPDIMTLSELLEVAASIKIEQSNAKKMFEAGRLDQEGLRHLIRAYSRGERLEPVLQERLRKVEVIPSFETAPPITTTTSDFPATSVVAGLAEQTMQAQRPEYQPYQLPDSYQPATPQKASKSPMQAAPLAGSIVAGIVIALLIVLFVLR